MPKSSPIVANLLNTNSARQYVDFVAQSSEEDRAILQMELPLLTWCKKWHKLANSKIPEKKTYQAFLNELLSESFLNYQRFDAKSGEYDFERGPRRRPHDCVVGTLGLDDKNSVFVTAIEVKSPKWHLDLDRNEKGETVLEQAINVAEGNPFLRQVVTTNYKTIRYYVPLFGLEFYQEFTLEQLLNHADSRRLFLALFVPSLLRNSGTTGLRAQLHACIEKTLRERRKKIDSLYGIYVDSLNSATGAVAKLARGPLKDDTVQHRQLATQFVNRFLFSEYAYQSGLVSFSIQDILKENSSNINTFSGFFNLMDKGGKYKDQSCPHFNGGLFAKVPELDAIPVEGTLKRHLSNLTQIELGDLAPQVLGRIFEQSLSQNLAELPNSPTESDELGAVYTPADLASSMTKLCFDLVDNKNASVLDPACGSGVFLLESLKYLLNGSEQRNARTIESILSKKIAGWDINPAAVELTRFMIWQYVAMLDLPLPSIKNNIHVGDALLDRIHTYNHSPDIIIGNPPFIAHQNLRKSYKESLEKAFPTTLDPAQQYDICIAFFEKALSVVKEDGVVAFIAPNQLSFRPYGKKLRDYLTSKHEIERIVDLTEASVFDRAICPFVYVVRKGSTKTKSYNVYTDIKRRHDIIDAFEYPTPQHTAFVEMAHSPESSYLARGKVSTGVAKIDDWRPDLSKDFDKVASHITQSPHRGKVLELRSGAGKQINVVTSKLTPEGPSIKKIKVSGVESKRIQEKFGENKIVFPRFFPSQMTTRIADKNTAVADNVYYLKSSEIREDSPVTLEALNALFNSRIYSLLDYAKSGLDRINEMGFRALDGEKFKELTLPALTPTDAKKLVSLFNDASPHRSMLDDPESFGSNNRVQRTRLKHLLDYERFVAKLFEFDLTSSELRVVLQWWADRRRLFQPTEEKAA